MSNRREILRRQVVESLEEELPSQLHPVLRRIYAARGVHSDHLDTSLSALLPVSQLGGTAAAAERLWQAFTEKQRVVVVGDFDADGATATALVMSCLRAYGFTEPAYLVPDREKFGYGLSVGIVEKAAALAPKLIVTVDNGISSHAGVHAASESGIDVIITDHHLPGETLPAAAVIVNPNAPGNCFPSKCLAGVGVAFYVMAALGQRLAAEGVIDAGTARSICAACLDLVALGTVADLVPLDFNNRVLIAQGLKRIRTGGSRAGIEALFKAARRNIADAVASDLGFSIAPRLNAAGRLDDMSVGIDCLLADSAAHAHARAAQLSQLNDDRRKLQSKMQQDAELHLDALEALADDSVGEAVCLFDPSWHPGVVGLVATRIKDRINRPAIAFAAGSEDGTLKGSGRSVAGVHMRDILAAIDARHPDLINRFGGHAMAAGLSLRPGMLDTFTAAFVAEVQQHADQIDDSNQIWSDGGLEAQEIGLPLAEELRLAGPWGQGFPEPAFDGHFEILEQRIVGESHLKLELQPLGSSSSVSAIAFNHPELLPTDRATECIAVYKLDVNEFRQVRKHQLVVEHIECV
jgi:single-stranded-DNA-specific exonuclease